MKPLEKKMYLPDCDNPSGLHPMPKQQCEEPEDIYYDDDCGTCGGDGFIMLSEAGPSAWGEDCFSEIDRPIPCPDCNAKPL